VTQLFPLLSNQDEEAADHDDRNHNNGRGCIEQVPNRKIFIVCCHLDLSYFASYFVAFEPLQSWLRNPARIMYGAGQSEGTAPSKRGMAKLLPHPVHSYATTLPNNMVWGTNLGCSTISSNESYALPVFTVTRHGESGLRQAVFQSQQASFAGDIVSINACVECGSLLDNNCENASTSAGWHQKSNCYLQSLSALRLNVKYNLNVLRLYYVVSMMAFQLLVQRGKAHDPLCLASRRLMFDGHALTGAR